MVRKGGIIDCGVCEVCEIGFIVVGFLVECPVFSVCVDNVVSIVVVGVGWLLVGCIVCNNGLIDDGLDQKLVCCVGIGFLLFSGIPTSFEGLFLTHRGGGGMVRQPCMGLWVDRALRA